MGMRSLCRVVLLCTSLLWSEYVLSQDAEVGTLTGEITSSADKKPIPSGTIVVAGTTNGTVTDIYGKYIIRNIHAGKQSIKISCIGYTAKTIEIDIQANTTNKLNAALDLTSIDVEEVVITSQRIGQQAAINEQVHAVVVKSVVSADRLQENPDANLAESIGRLPGVSLVRSGGEGTGAVIRGLSSNYSQVLLDGIPLPSPDLYGISQYGIQGAEVFKSITPDMEADAPAGTINLTLSRAPSGMKTSLLAEGGYNSLNDYWKNYRFVGDFSNRYFDDDLGVLLNVNMENVNRSNQALGATYISRSVAPVGQLAPIYATEVTLNDVKRINQRAGGTLLLDYRLSPSTSLSLSNFYSHFKQDLTGVSKHYDVNTGGLGIGITNSPDNSSELYVGSLKAVHEFALFEMDEGIAFSQSHKYSPNSRSWGFGSLSPMLSRYGDMATQSLPLDQILALSRADADSSLQDFQFASMGYSPSDILEQNTKAYLDLKAPFNIGKSVSAYIKIGGEYKKYRQDAKMSAQTADIKNVNNFMAIAQPYFPWIKVATSPGRASIAGINDYLLDDFIKGLYNFGWYPNVSRLNEIYDWWNVWSRANTFTSTVPGWPVKGQPGYIPDWETTLMNTHELSGDYYAGYAMGEVNFGDVVLFTPGVRYEKVKNKLNGWELSTVPNQANVWLNQGIKHEATHSDDYWLPMAHLKIKPADWMHVLASYTQTLKRPDWGSLVPNVLYYNGGGSDEYQSGNPGLRPELWTSYDLQVAAFGNEIGLLSIGGFYKTVKDMIWEPTTYRTSGQPWPFGLNLDRYFPDNATVQIKMAQNFNYTVYLKGLELEVQSSLWYLPEPFDRITLNANVTFINSTTTYQYSKTQTIQTGVDNRGRPIFKLVTVDSIYSGPMLNQPKSIANFSIGYNYKGFNIWMSYQYTGAMITDFPNLPEFEGNKSQFSRWDFQIRQALPVQGLELLFNFANINDPIEYQNYQADTRPTYVENYGWTTDFGIRYKF
jgi:TonB-dependent receptor